MKMILPMQGSPIWAQWSVHMTDCGNFNIIAIFLEEASISVIKNEGPW